eukprot:1905436-Ditylum_brightwellii.AAC.1
MATDPNHANTIKELAAELEALKTTAASLNVELDGVAYSQDVLTIHELLKKHKVVYKPTQSPSGKWVWGGLCEIRKKAGAQS